MGPTSKAFDQIASSGELKPQKLENTLAFMFETRYPQQVTEYAAKLPALQSDYADCWLGLEKHFDRREY